MITYYTKYNLKGLKNVWSMGYHGKSRKTTVKIVKEYKRMAPYESCLVPSNPIQTQAFVCEPKRH